MKAYPKDDILIQGVKKKDNTALHRLYDKYAPALFGVVLRMVKDNTMAEDVLQDTFLKIWNNIEKYDASKGRFYTWAYRIAKNTALNALRNSKKLIQTENLSVVTSTDEPNSDDNWASLNGAIKKLAPHHQKAVALVYFEGHTHKEAHELMQVPLGTFKSYIRQALQQLRKAYGKELILIGLIMKWFNLLHNG